MRPEALCHLSLDRFDFSARSRLRRAEHRRTRLRATAVAQPVSITLEEAIHRAQANEPSYATALADSRVAALDRSIARAALLPGVTYHNQYLYTQPLVNAGRAAGVLPDHSTIYRQQRRPRVFQPGRCGRNHWSRAGGRRAPRERRRSPRRCRTRDLPPRAGVHRERPLLWRDCGRSQAGDRRAGPRRGLRLYLADRQARTGARSRPRRCGEGAAPAAAARTRTFRRARWPPKKPGSNSAYCCFPIRGPHIRWPLRIPLNWPPAPMSSWPPARTTPNCAAPWPRSTKAVPRFSPPAAHILPSLGLNYTYGIDAPQFAVNGPDKVRNLGYSASVTLDIPVWDWLAMEHKVKQSEIRRDAAKVALTVSAAPSDCPARRSIL